MLAFFQKNQKAIIAITLQIVLLGIACAILYQPMMNFLADPVTLKLQLQSYGVLGIVVMILIVAGQVVFAFLPGEIVEVLSGYIYGDIFGMIICMIGMSLGTMIIFGLVKLFGNSVLYRMINKDELQKVRFLQDSQRLDMLLFIIFFIPGTPKDLITYFAPLLKIKLHKFILITMFARIPSIITSTIGGNAIGEKNYLFSIVVFVITGIISLIGIYFYQRYIVKNKAKGEA
ncbi:MAG: VTT domain-containing protein [Erysipelotrichaceae bacterium]|nr:VTT domain-containing protein [Erysipelotrichaceae bacterium]MDY5252157.1 VTT domain-containing protein [Erysipelotrichaceae bacterium]